MSDSEGDIDDELLELAGAGEKKRKRSQQNTSAKRYKVDTSHDSDSETGQPESEEEMEANPYPLEGKFIDEEDRNRLMEMPEIEREEVLAQRQEELQRFADKRQLDQMLKLRSGAGAEEAVSKAAKRQHAIRGATKEKTKKLDELKAKRKAKDERKRTRTNSPKRDRSSSPMDMDMSDEEEDGQITKYDEEEERDRKLFSKLTPEEELPMALEDLEKCRVTRNQIAKYCLAPWFGEYIKGAWVRYLIGEENKQPVYRICEVVDLPEATVKPYKVDDQLVNQDLELKHGGSTRRFAMDKISNGPFEEKEFERLNKTCETEKVKLPMKRQLEKKAAQLQKLANQPMTESDIAAILQRKRDINVSANKSTTSHTMERSRLQQARTLAIRRQDYTELVQIDAKLAELQASAPVRERETESSSDILAKVNERNRKMNMEQVRRAERAEMERRRREKLAKAKGASPSGAALDAAARMKARMGAARPDAPGTPPLGGGEGDSTPRSVSPAAPPPAGSKSNGSLSFQASLLQSVEIDLGDF